MSLSVAARLAAAILCASAVLCAGPGAEDLRAIKGLELDPDNCFRVRDVFLEREDAKFYFTDGHIVFAKPVLGRILAALFVATEPTDVGEILLIPPSPAERQSVARFLGETILNEKFRNAMMFFTDDTARELDAAIRDAPGSKPDAEAGARIAPRWSIVLRNLIESSAPRALVDLYSGAEGADGFFSAAVRGGILGRFDIVVDPSLPEQVIAGQLVRSGGRAYYEVWSRFEARSARNGRRARPPAVGHLSDYRIEARLGTGLDLSVHAAATLVLSNPQARAVAFELADSLEVTAVRVSGEEVEFLQERLPRAGPRKRNEFAIVVVILPERLRVADRQEIEFEYAGKVVTDAGSGIYYVGDRTNWYPRLGDEPAQYELNFRYPGHLELVATGELVADYTREGMRFSQFRSGKPIRIAGFNLGTYAAASREVERFRIEVRATKGVESRLAPNPVPVILPDTTLTGRRRDRRSAPVLVAPNPAPVSPADDLERIADESAASFRYFLERFGEPAMPVTVISPVPGDFGQGFPGLVYAATLSYFERGDRPLRNLSPTQQRFYADLMRPHEIAHQWWGNVVNAPLDRDAWLMEALATYSSLLWLEEQDGVKERDAVLAGFIRNLQNRSDGKTVESAGPVVLGRRLRTSKVPEAYRVIVYEKGAWIMHMLRGVLGDRAFFGMLRTLCESAAGASITTEGFRELAAEYVPEGYRDPELRDFFDEWVYGTGIPKLTAKWSQKARGGRHHFELHLSMSGVDRFFPLQVPVEVHTLPQRSLVKTVTVGDGEDEAGFSVVLRNPASRVVIDPQGSLLAVKQ